MSEVPEHIDGRFFFRELIGTGGMGEVWRGIQEPLGRPVAIKLLRRELTEDPEVRRRFAREARASCALGHQNVAALYDFGVDRSGRLYIAMELADGPSLATLIRKRVPLTGLELLGLTDQILAGLAHAHARGVVHRDLKPDNIVFADQNLPSSLGVVKIVDFGIASVAGSPDDDAAPAKALGTPCYMSPEQALGGRNLSPRTDLYNVGLVLYELIAGRAPFGELDGLEVMEHHVYEEIPPLIPRRGVELPRELDAVIERALAKKPVDRWASAGEMREALAAAFASLERDDWRPRTSPRVDYAPVRVNDSAVTRPPAAPRSPLVGRASERRTLQRAVDRALDQRRGNIILLEGEAGVGKTRLVAWARELVEEEGSMRANFGSFTHADRSNLRGVQEVFETIFRTQGFHRSDLAARVTRRLREWEYDSPEDRDAIVDFLRPDAAGVERPDETARLFAALARVLAVAARPQPRLIVLEDLHWAGRETFDFLDYLAVEFRQHDLPVVVVATYRPEELESRYGLGDRLARLSRYVGESVERIALEPLTHDAGRALIESLLPVTDEVAEIVLQRSRSIPLHTITLLRYLEAEGILRDEGGRMGAVDLDSVRHAVPPDLGALFDRRLTQAERREELLAPVRELATIAAFAGLRFDFAVVEKMVQVVGSAALVEHFDRSFDRLLSEEFVVADDRGGDAYTFSHALLRDWLLEETTGDAWHRLHSSAAVAKVSVYRRHGPEHGFDIAWHLREAGDWRQAVDWYENTARLARTGFAPRQAARALRSAIRLIDSQLDLDTEVVHPFNAAILDEDFERLGIEKAYFLELLTQLGDLHDGFGDWDLAERAFRRVVVQVGPAKEAATIDVLRPLAHSWLGIGHVARQRGDLEGARWAFDRVLELAADRPVDPSVFERASRGMARVAWLESDYEEAEDRAEAAHTSALARGDLHAQAVAVWLLGDIARVQGDHDIARQRYESSLEMHRDSNDQTGIARNLLGLAQLARHRRDLSRAAEFYQRAHSLWRTLGNRRGAGLCLNGLGDVARFERRFADARVAYEAAADIFHAIGARYDHAVAIANLGINAIGLGRLGDAADHLARARAEVEGNSYPYLEAGIEFHLALIAELGHGVRHDPSDAPVPDLDYALPLEQMASLRARKGERREAEALWARAREIYSRVGLDADVERLDDLLAS